MFKKKGDKGGHAREGEMAWQIFLGKRAQFQPGKQFIGQATPFRSAWNHWKYGQKG